MLSLRGALLLYVAWLASLGLLACVSWLVRG